MAKKSNQALKSDVHPVNATNVKSADGCKNENKPISRKEISSAANNKCADGSKNSSNSLNEKEILNLTNNKCADGSQNNNTSLNENEIPNLTDNKAADSSKNCNNFLNEKEIPNLTNNKFADGSKNSNNSLNEKEIPNLTNNTSADALKDSDKSLNVKEIASQVGSASSSKVFIVKVTAAKTESYKAVDNKESNENIVSPITVNNENANSIPNQIIAAQSVVVPPRTQNPTNRIANVIQYILIKPKSPVYQAAVIEASRKESVARKGEGVIFLKCDICDKIFTRACSLSRHKRQIHKVNLPSESLRYACRFCKVPLSSFKNRWKHEKTFHKSENIKYKRTFQCPECFLIVSGKKAIIKHISEFHNNINMKSETMTFKSLDEFKKWKEKIEKDTASQFVLENSTKYKDYYKRTEYVCHRSGAFISRNSGKRNPKFNGSNKTGFFCPAHMAIKTSVTEDSSVEVVFMLKHLGHECEVERINIGKRLKSHSGKLHQCRVCKKFFSRSSYRRSHERNVHGLDAAYELELKCPKCFSVFPSRKDIMHHISRFHSDIHLETSDMIFKSPKEFEEWKLAMEKRTTSEYVLDRFYSRKVYNVQRFNCHLSGASETGVFCPASLLVKSCRISDKSINVTYLSTHVGHEGELQHEQLMDMLPSVHNNKVKKNISVKNSHLAAVKILNSVNVVQNDENTWTILPFLNETKTYEVKRLDIDFDHTCKIKCLSCNVCQHQFTCNCSDDSLFTYNICTHIHIICLKNHQVVEEDSVEVDDSYFEVSTSYSDQEDINELENCVLQGIRGNLQFKNLREQAVSALSGLLTEINECTDEKKLKELIKDISILKNKISSSAGVPLASSQVIPKKKHFLPKKKRKVERNCHSNQNQNDILERAIEVTIHSDSPNLMHTSNFN